MTSLAANAVGSAAGSTAGNMAQGLAKGRGENNVDLQIAKQLNNSGHQAAKNQATEQRIKNNYECTYLPVQAQQIGQGVECE